MRRAGAALLAALTGCAPDEVRPDLVLIGIDTLRADHLGCYGHVRDTSPAIDAWAAGGTLFERAYAPSSWTLPSMAMLWTGRVRSDNSGDLDERHPTLPERLAADGYEGHGVVSNALLHPDKGFARGFETYDLFRPGEGGRVNGWPAEEVVRRGLERWDDAAGGPRFLFLFFFDPHDPYRPPDTFGFEPFDDAERRARFERALPADRRALLTDEAYRGIEKRIALYDAEIRATDEALGLLFERLEREGADRDTVVALFSDHGEGLWQRAKLVGENDKQFAYFPELYFDHGVMLYEEQVRVPLVLRGVGVPAGARRDEVVWTLDLVPTLARLLGLRELGALDAAEAGLDLFDARALAGRPDLVAFTSRGASWLGGGRYKLHVPREYRVERYGAQPELYDLAADPLELEELDDAERLTEGLARLEAWRERADRAAPKAIDPAERARLEALGYTVEADRVAPENDGR